MLVVFDVEYFRDIATEIDDFLFVTPILSAFVDVLEGMMSFRSTLC